MNLELLALARELIAGCRVVPVDIAIVKLSMNIAERHSVSHWDALIVAAALLSGCDTLYSEDMQHGQMFEGRLTEDSGKHSSRCYPSW